MYAISKAESFWVVGYNKDGTQMRLCTARTLPLLLTAWSKEVARWASMGKNNILPTFKKIVVWSVEDGYTGLDLPWIESV